MCTNGTEIMVDKTAGNLEKLNMVVPNSTSDYFILDQHALTIKICQFHL